MARYHDIDTSIWEELKPFSRDEKLLYVYSFSNPLVRDSGLYKISAETIRFYTGLSDKKLKECLDRLHPKLVYDFENQVMFVAGKFKRRLSGLKANKNLIKALEHDLEVFKASFVSLLFIKKYEGALKGLLSLSLPLPLPLNTTDNIISKDQGKEIEIPGLGKMVSTWKDKGK